MQKHLATQAYHVREFSSESEAGEHPAKKLKLNDEVINLFSDEDELGGAPKGNSLANSTKAAAAPSQPIYTRRQRPIAGFNKVVEISSDSEDGDARLPKKRKLDDVVIDLTSDDDEGLGWVEKNSRGSISDPIVVSDEESVKSVKSVHEDKGKGRAVFDEETGQISRKDKGKRRAF